MSSMSSSGEQRMDSVEPVHTDRSVSDAMQVIREENPQLASRLKTLIALLHMVIGLALMILVAVNQMYNRTDINLAVLIMTTIDNIIKGYLRSGSRNKERTA